MGDRIGDYRALSEYPESAENSILIQEKLESDPGLKARWESVVKFGYELKAALDGWEIANEEGKKAIGDSFGFRKYKFDLLVNRFSPKQIPAPEWPARGQNRKTRKI